jgi:hypothetical protein
VDRVVHAAALLPLRASNRLEDRLPETFGPRAYFPSLMTQVKHAVHTRRRGDSRFRCSHVRVYFTSLMTQVKHAVHTRPVAVRGKETDRGPGDRATPPECGTGPGV